MAAADVGWRGRVIREGGVCRTRRLAGRVFRAAGLLRDDELLDRYRAAGWALLSALLDEGRTEDGADLWIVNAAIDNAREGFAAFLLDETIPPGRDYDALHAWLLEHSRR